MNKRRNILILLMLILAIIFFTPGCKIAKKPEIPQASPEINKYKEEPTIILYRKETGKKEQIKLEEYIKGVVAAEIGPKFPMEALKSQAIVARTMTLALMEYEDNTKKEHGADVSDDHTEFQAYDRKGITEDISKAVDETRGQVLTNKGKFLYALFHSASKDMTASIEEGFPELKEKASYLVPVPTDGIKNAPDKYHNWTLKFPKEQVRRAMGKESGSLDDIRIDKRGPSGRVLTIKAGGVSISAVDLRKELGFDKLYSTNLNSLRAEGNMIVFKGDGWGHGCGMEQWGAYTMAEEGKNARQILKHYYPESVWYKLYD